MKTAAITSLNASKTLIQTKKTDIRTLANQYAAHLSHCRLPTSYSLVHPLHAHMITNGFLPRGHILNTLIDIYCKSFNLLYARHLFDKIPQPDIVSRTTMIAAYSENGKPNISHEIFYKTPFGIRDTVFYNAMITAYSRNNDGFAAIELFRDMRWNGFAPDNYTYTSVLSALALVADQETHCQQFHCTVVKSGTGLVTSVLNALVSVYVKCASSPLVASSLLMGSAKKLFDEMPVRDELSWTTIITGYVRNGDLVSACNVFEGMREKLVVGWNAMISGYVHHGFVIKALEMFRKMRLLGINLDEFTYTSALSACANVGSLIHGKEIHAYILRAENEPSRDFSLSVNNALMTVYWKCGSIDEARKIFENMPSKDLVSYNAILSAYVSAGRITEARSYFSEMREKNHLTWTVMISGLAQNGFGEDGLKLFTQMKLECFEPCDYVFAGAITSCAVLASLEIGRQIHAQLVRSGYDISLSACNALITMYGRCGVVDSANLVFLTMPFIDSVSWNALIAALGQHGHGNRALELFEQMLKDDFTPDRISFLTILSACSHAGLIEQGRMYFDRMYTWYGITPGEDHYARFVDLLCRAGKFSEAKEVIMKMPFEPGVPIWEALLGGCRIYGNMDLGIEVAERLFELTPHHDGTYVLLSNMYANRGRWDEVARVRKLMRDRGVKKEPGCSWVEVENKVHVFLVDDAAHPEVRLVYDYLEKLDLKMRELGYVPENRYVTRDIEFEGRDYVLSTHSEKLAVAFGLMKVPFGATVRVFKNLRICGDCHNAFKFMSIVAEREIVVRDGKRFHHFRNGECSCGNYW